ncbi:MAG: MFS transporter [Nitrospinae bacterium]|nr:MFS transporter [Nitrospinota bacterium]
MKDSTAWREKIKIWSAGWKTVRRNARPSGMFGFMIVWLGQVISVLASGMSQFALSIFMFERTQSATALGLMQVFFFFSLLVVSPVAGVMVDRHDRKLMMMAGDFAAGLATLFILAVVHFEAWQFWHMYVASSVFGLGMAFQWPAYSAAISTMMPKKHLGRAYGMMSLLDAGPGVITPILAGALLPVIGLAGILLVDFTTFLLAICALMIVHIPRPERTREGAQARGGMLKEAFYGFRYILKRPGLLCLQLVFFAGNLFLGMGVTLLAPMILSRTGNDSLMLGSVQTAGAMGSLAGGAIMSAWGGFKRRIHGVLLGWIWVGIGTSAIGFAGGLPVWVTGMALFSIAVPLVNGSNQAIWQSKVAQDLQGRVFTSRRLIGSIATPFSPVIAGVLADFALEPAARAGTGLPSAFSWLVGVGPGSGMGLLIVFSGLMAAVVGLSGYLVPAIYKVETILPDNDGLAKAEPA